MFWIEWNVRPNAPCSAAKKVELALLICFCIEALLKVRHAATTNMRPLYMRRAVTGMALPNVAAPSQPIGYNLLVPVMDKALLEIFVP